MAAPQGYPLLCLENPLLGAYAIPRSLLLEYAANFSI
jgi:hypothetical protein